MLLLSAPTWRTDALYISTASRGIASQSEWSPNPNWKAPADGEILFAAVATCGPFPPGQLRAKQALLSEHIEEVNECMGLEDGDPMMVSKKCSGQTCNFALDNHASKCLLHSYGYHEDEFCGQEVDGADGLEDGMGMVGQDCVSLIPSGVLPKVWGKCKQNSSLLHLELSFESAMPTETDYICEIRPTVWKTSFASWVVCHTSSNTLEPASTVDSQHSTSGGSGTLHSMVLMVALSFLGLWLIVGL